MLASLIERLTIIAIAPLVHLDGLHRQDVHVLVFEIESPLV